LATPVGTEHFVHTRLESGRVQYGERLVHRELPSCFHTSAQSALDTPLLSLRFADSGGDSPPHRHDGIFHPAIPNYHFGTSSSVTVVESLYRGVIVTPYAYRDLPSSVSLLPMPFCRCVPERTRCHRQARPRLSKPEQQCHRRYQVQHFYQHHQSEHSEAVTSALLFGAFQLR